MHGLLLTDYTLMALCRTVTREGGQFLSTDLPRRQRRYCNGCQQVMHVQVFFMATNGSPAYYQTGFQIDGTSVTPKWQNASTPASGNANSIDVYTFNIIKTGSATYTVLAAQTRFA